MSEPTIDDLDVVFRAYGAACFAAQHLESALRVLLVLSTAAKQQQMNMHILRLVESETAMDTLRQLFNAAREREYFTGAEVKSIDRAIKRRNFIIHSYWHKHTMLLSTAKGRAWLCDDLQHARAVMRDANGIVNSLCDRYWEQYGMSTKALNELIGALWEGENDPPDDLLL